MKTDFAGYYAPTEEEYQRIWDEGLIVLDTNVLLNFYRLPAIARDELFTVLDILKERLWVLHQVALEFQRNRLSVIAAERKITEDALAKVTNLFQQINDHVNPLQIDKRGLNVSVNEFLEEIKQANDKLLGVINTVH